MVHLPGKSLPFEHTIVEGSERETRGGSPASNDINKAAAHVHRRRRFSMVEQEIKISFTFRAARHLNLIGNVSERRLETHFTGITPDEIARGIHIEEGAIINRPSLSEQLLGCRRRVLEIIAFPPGEHTRSRGTQHFSEDVDRQ